MNIEDLSKSQLLLLTILVNFVVSIATGVLTVSMLDQAPTTVTQTVNKIVDHTIETISAPLPPVTTKPGQSSSPEQLLTNAIAADEARAVSIHAGTSTTSPIVAVGTYLPKSRGVATATTQDLPKDVLIEFNSGDTQPASISHQGATVTIYGFADAAKLPPAPAATLPAASSLKQGQTVVTLSKENEALTGIISKVDDAGIHTNLPGVVAGAGVVDLAGNVIGIGSGSDGLLLPADKISTLLSEPPPAAPK